MKTMVFKKTVEDGRPCEDDQPFDCFMKLETRAEAMVYYHFEETYRKGYDEDTKHLVRWLWDDMLTTAEDVNSDDDVYYYFMPEETTPEVGESWGLDNDKWIRVK